jgi:cell division protein FtsL
VTGDDRVLVGTLLVAFLILVLLIVYDGRDFFNSDEDDRK